MWWNGRRGPVAAEAFAEKVFQEYHYYIHWTWEDHVEPTQPFTPYDPNATPEPEILTEEEAKKKRERVKYLNEVSVIFLIWTCTYLRLADYTLATVLGKEAHEKILENASSQYQ